MCDLNFNFPLQCINQYLATTSLMWHYFNLPLEVHWHDSFDYRSHLFLSGLPFCNEKMAILIGVASLEVGQFCSILLSTNLKSGLINSHYVVSSTPYIVELQVQTLPITILLIVTCCKSICFTAFINIIITIKISLSMFNLLLLF